eukprot:4412091-Lingulodinium_polyedra.AAC.1
MVRFTPNRRPSPPVLPAALWEPWLMSHGIWMRPLGRLRPTSAASKRGQRRPRPTGLPLGPL